MESFGWHYNTLKQTNESEIKTGQLTFKNFHFRHKFCIVLNVFFFHFCGVPKKIRLNFLITCWNLSDTMVIFKKNTHICLMCTLNEKCLQILFFRTDFEPSLWVESSTNTPLHSTRFKTLLRTKNSLDKIIKGLNQKW
jgi:hypothetical protein